MFLKLLQQNCEVGSKAENVNTNHTDTDLCHNFEFE